MHSSVFFHCFRDSVAIWLSASFTLLAETRVSLFFFYSGSLFSGPRMDTVPRCGAVEGLGCLPLFPPFSLFFLWVARRLAPFPQGNVGARFLSPFFSPCLLGVPDRACSRAVAFVFFFLKSFLGGGHRARTSPFPRSFSFGRTGQRGLIRLQSSFGLSSRRLRSFTLALLSRGAVVGFLFLRCHSARY